MAMGRREQLVVGSGVGMKFPQVVHRSFYPSDLRISASLCLCGRLTSVFLCLCDSMPPSVRVIYSQPRMPNYGFAIDLRKCIGCHACTIACKAEHDIPVGVNRCWVKTVEQGTFPDTRRFFFPVLCNQCDEAPCAKICPTNALFKRRDGIVDLHGDSCIGCRACMVACPYDQLFIDPNTHTAEKCNFCANRVENELLPACVSVCPTECRIFGDLDDPSSEVAQIAAREMTKVRKPEKGTIPKVFYIAAEESVIQPEIATRPFMYKEGQVLLRPLGSPEAGSRAARRRARRLRHAAQEAVGLRHGALPADQGDRHRHDARQPAAAVRLRRRLSADDHRRPDDLAGVPGDHRGAARRRPRSARALLLHPDAPELAIVDGVGRLLPDRAGAADDAVDRRGMVRRRTRARMAALADRRLLDADDRLHRLPVRAGAGARSVAGTGSRRSTSSRRRSSKARRRCCSRR